MQRLAKIINKAGICSRREAEKLIESGEVKIDGVVVDKVMTFVDEKSTIEISGKIIDRETTKEPRIWVYYKPVGLITTHRDTHDRETVFDNLDGLPRVVSIGRLDINSEGLLLLTNDGKVVRHFELPSNKVERIYKVRAFGNYRNIISAKFPVLIDDVFYSPKSIKLINSGPNSWFEVVLTEGKNREIRRIFEHYDLKVNRLIRVKYGPYSLSTLKPGEYREEKLIIKRRSND